MTEWKEIKKDGRPKEHCMCWVNNIRGGMNCFVAIYDPYRDIFTEYDPERLQHPVLDVTHYVEIPYAPEEE